MILFLAYFNRSHQELLAETIDNVDWDDDDKEGYYKSEQMKKDVYSLKLIILQQYYGDEFKSEVVDRQEKNEKYFDEHFEYNVWLIPRKTVI